MVSDKKMNETASEVKKKLLYLESIGFYWRNVHGSIDSSLRGLILRGEIIDDLGLVK